MGSLPLLLTALLGLQVGIEEGGWKAEEAWIEASHEDRDDVSLDSLPDGEKPPFQAPSSRGWSRGILFGRLDDGTEAWVTGDEHARGRQAIWSLLIRNRRMLGRTCTAAPSYGTGCDARVLEWNASWLLRHPIEGGGTATLLVHQWSVPLLNHGPVLFTVLEVPDDAPPRPVEWVSIEEGCRRRFRPSDREVEAPLGDLWQGSFSESRFVWRPGDEWNASAILEAHYRLVRTQQDALGVKHLRLEPALCHRTDPLSPDPILDAFKVAVAMFDVSSSRRVAPSFQNRRYREESR